MPATALPDHIHLGPVHLVVGDLATMSTYYEQRIGLEVMRHEGDEVALGAGDEELVVLRGDPGAPEAGSTSGLFHVALLFAQRAELARTLRRLVTTRTALTGASDHGVSEALYLRDPEGNGIELYADRPREAWPAPGPGERIGMYTARLDLEDLLEAAPEPEVQVRVAPGVRVGHVHLEVGDPEAVADFHVEVLGFEAMVRFPGAAFLARDGYHHHLGINGWRGPLGAHEAGRRGLAAWTVVLPDAAALEVARERLGERARSDGDGAVVVCDPAQVPVHLVAG